MRKQAPANTQPFKRVAIVGAGIIGLTCARAFASRGATVTIFDKYEPGRGASWAAAGMLAPAFEAASEDHANPSLFELCRAGGEMWQDFASRLERDCGHQVGFRAGPSLAVAITPPQCDALNAIAAALGARGVPHSSLSKCQVTAFQAGLSSELLGALLLPSDGQVDNRLVVEGLLRACSTSRRIELRVGQAIHRPEDLLLDHDEVVCTAGWQTPDILDGLNVKPVGGQLLAVERVPDSPEHTIRCGSIYIAPKADRIVIGASVEPGVVRQGFDDETIEALRQAAIAICPGLEEARILEKWAGIRPGTPDHAPILGPSRIENVYAATGHGRNGILLAPITAKIMADMILDGHVSALAAAFSPRRFASAKV